MRSWRARELMRKAMQEMVEGARGLTPAVTRFGSGREADIRIANRNSLPVQTPVPGTSALAPPGAGSPPNGPILISLPSPLSTSSRNFYYLKGYSAEAGTPEARPDATGRGLQTYVRMSSHGRSAVSASARLTVKAPLASASVCATQSSAGATITQQLAAASKCATMGMATFGAAPPPPLAHGYAATSSTARLTGRIAMGTAAAHCATRSGSLLTVVNEITASGHSASHGLATLTQRAPGSAGAGIAATHGTATLIFGRLAARAAGIAATKGIGALSLALPCGGGGTTSSMLVTGSGSSRSFSVGPSGSWSAGYITVHADDGVYSMAAISGSTLTVTVSGGVGYVALDSSYLGQVNSHSLSGTISKSSSFTLTSMSITLC